MKVKQEDGTEIEVFTQQEVDAKMQTTAQELATAKEELLKANDKDLNFSTLRKKVEELEKKDFDNKNLVIETILSQKSADRIKELSNGDIELEKKIKFNFDRIKDEAKSPEELEKKMQDALVLSGGSPKNALNGAITAAGGAINVRPFAGEKSLKPELGDIAKKFGITSDDVDKYYKNK
ncbi:hypothetical protein M0R04_10190 [Candidatus Dojkabacteria bacterium]|jgi:hypothetical protein|nr:hypothetical protein [Candidatus Dojkabacteria bacterium]